METLDVRFETPIASHNYFISCLTSYFSFLFFTFFLIAQSAFAQDFGRAQSSDTIALRYSKKITEEDLSRYLHVLASDSLEGRETGKEGQRKAARYIAAHFDSLGIPPCNHGIYFQDFALNTKSIVAHNIQINRNNLLYMKDYYYLSGNKDTSLTIDKIQFAGYGIEDEKYNDFENIKETTTDIIYFEGEPVDKKGTSKITGSKTLSGWSTDWRKKADAIRKRNPEVVFVITANLDKIIDSLNYSGKTAADFRSRPNSPSPIIIYITHDALIQFLPAEALDALEKAKRKIDKKGKPQSFVLNINADIHILYNTDALKGKNVLGYIEGTDLKNELLVISAHNDHLGKKDSVIYHGADDDGSGTSALMELAKTFALAKKEGHGPRRSILFLSFGGEEKGLLGSLWYTDHPVFPLANTITDLNIDMIGRIDEKHKDSANYVYIIGSDKLSTTLHKINEENNTEYSHLALDYMYNRPDDTNHFYYRSDHYNFAKHGIPIIFYFNGVHADYHKPTDTVDKINFFMMMWRTKLVFFTAWQLANMDKRPAVDVKKDFEK